MVEAAAIPVTILTGFLGSGKTTLLNKLLAAPAYRDTAVVVNEFGDIAVDHDLVTVGSREIMVTTTGCVCCTAGSDVRSSLAELIAVACAGTVPRFSRVVVETTGLADPAPVINQIVPGAMRPASSRDVEVSDGFRLSGVVCTIDIVSGDLTIDRFLEAMKQVAFADRIVLTKTDLAHDPASLADVRALRDRLHDLNAFAPILDANAPAFDLEDLFAPRAYAPSDLSSDVEGWLALEQALAIEAGVGSAHGAGSRHASGRIVTTALVSEQPVRRRDLDAFLLLLGAAASNRLLRLKGFVCLEDETDRPLVVHCVQHSVHPPRCLEAWPSADHRTRLVAITHDLDPRILRRLFDALTGKAGRWSFRNAAIAVGAVAGVAAVGIGLTLAAHSLAAHGPVSAPEAPPAVSTDP